MITLSLLLFWIPVCIGITSFCYLTKRSKKTIVLMLSFTPTAFFILKIVQYTFYDSLNTWFYSLLGLFLSITFFILVIRYFYKR